jgi:hypothetical protein
MASRELPPGTDAALYDRVSELGLSLANPNAASKTRKSAWGLFVNAWNGLAYRLIAAHEYSVAFGQALGKAEDRYRQDHALFGFSFSSLSALECAFFAANSARLLLDGKEHAEIKGKALNISLDGIADAYKREFPGNPFTNLLGVIASSAELANLQDMRNALSHRGCLGRAAFFSTKEDIPYRIPSNPKALPAEFVYDLELVPALTERQMDWLVTTINGFSVEFIALLEGKNQ